MVQSRSSRLRFLRRKQRLEPLPLRVCKFFSFHTDECTPPVRVCTHALVYSTPPLERDVEVTGPLTVTLWAATSAPIPILPPNWWTCARTAARATSPTVSSARAIATHAPPPA